MLKPKNLLKKLQQSEYSTIEQLKRASVQTSILSLLMSFETHRNVLLKVLNESNVLNNTNQQELEQTVGQVFATKIIKFIEG